jgi:hypothetical protein
VEGAPPEQNAVIERGHPEATCEDCGGSNVVWFAPNGIWNRVCRPEGYERDPMLCPRCFAIRANRLGICGAWKMVLENTAAVEADAQPARAGSAENLSSHWCPACGGVGHNAVESVPWGAVRECSRCEGSGEL